MGIVCSSCESTSLANAPATVKLVLHDGQLEEVSHPVKASHVLQRHPACFVCDSDEMDFDSIVPAVDDDEELQLGRLYFVLPTRWLNSRLRPAEMASLAAKASLALKMSTSNRGAKSCRHCGGDGKAVVEPVLLTSTSDIRRTRSRSSDPENGGGGRSAVERRGRAGGGDRGSPRGRRQQGHRVRFSTGLSIILED